MRYLFATLMLLASSASAAFGQCGPNHMQICQPGKVPDAGIFGADYSACQASASHGQDCYKEAYSNYVPPQGGEPYTVPYCSATREGASCYCVQGEGIVETSGSCTLVP